ncbi:hypothetical protein BYT27DRAFT_6925634 [Phlegmacium glaucopus]|nr:hypothetical protein BYT27DRAFT_6925634 [Phlegmacium glaucopus]
MGLSLSSTSPPAPTSQMSTFNNHTTGRISVTNQPQPSVNLDFKQPIATSPFREKSLEDAQNHHDYEMHHHSSSSSEHHECHKNRLRQLFLPAILALLVLGGLLAWTCVNWHGLSNLGIDNLVGRAVSDTTSTNTGNMFIHNKLYLIVLFVGLFVVLILGIMLSAWCCKGSFSNPLCCPCYLCACCGGLVCLECICCGLCAEAV